VNYVTNIKVLTLTATSTGVLNKNKFKYIDEKIPEDSPVRCRKGDILLQRGNTRDLVGIPAIFDDNDQNYIFPDLMIKINPKEELITTDFLYFSLLSPRIRNHVRASANGSAGNMPKINQSIIEAIKIPTPPLDIQKKIVESIQIEKMSVDEARKLVEIFHKRIKSRIDEV
jgi:restriction endonuclease S subunit